MIKMYKYIIVILLISSMNSASAQQRISLRGYVYYISGVQKLPLSGANVVSNELSTPNVTNVSGYFKLEFTNKQPGETVIVSVEKPGYILKDILRVRLPSDPSDMTEIIMIKIGQNKSDFESFRRMIEKKQMLYLKKTDEQFVKIDVMCEKIDQLYNFLKNQDTTNASKGRIKAVSLAGEGKLEEAFQSIDEKTELKKLQTSMFKTDSLKASVKKDLLYKAKLAEANAAFKQADELYLQLINIDSTDANSLVEYGEFLHMLGKLPQSEFYYTKALTKYETLIKTQPSIEPDYARLLHNLARLLYEKKDFKRSIIYYTAALQIRQKLTQQLPEQYSADLAYTLNGLANLFLVKHEYGTALYYYNQALSLFNQLEQQNPTTQQYPISVIYLNFGLINESLKNWDEAEKDYKNAESFVRDYASQSLLYKSQLAKVLNNLGVLYNNKAEYSKSLIYHTEAFTIRKELGKVNPNGFEVAIIQSIANIANVYKSLNNYTLAEQYYIDALKRFRVLATQMPSTYEGSVALVLNNLAIVYQDTHQFGKAQSAFKESLAIYRKLAIIDPDVYEFEVVRVIMNTGVLYQKMVKQGEDYGNKSYITKLLEEGWERIKKVSPENIERTKFQQNIKSLYDFFNDPLDGLFNIF